MVEPQTVTSRTGCLAIRQARAQGIARVRLPEWAIPFDHLALGDVCHQFYSPFNLACNGRDPVPLLALTIDPDEPIYEPYTRALPGSEEYAAAVARFAGCLAEEG